MSFRRVSSKGNGLPSVMSIRCFIIRFFSNVLYFEHILFYLLHVFNTREFHIRLLYFFQVTNFDIRIYNTRIAPTAFLSIYFQLIIDSFVTLKMYLYQSTSFQLVANLYERKSWSHETHSNTKHNTPKWCICIDISWSRIEDLCTECDDTF